MAHGPLVLKFFVPYILSSADKATFSVGASLAQLVESRTLDRKVAGSKFTRCAVLFS